MLMRRCFQAVVCGAAVLSAANAHAWFSSRDAGTCGAQFLKLPTGARASSMGGAFVGISDDAEALDYNPAGLAMIKQAQISGMHHEFLGLFRQDVLAYIQPISDASGAAGSLQALSQDAMEKMDGAGNSTSGTFSPLDMAAKLGYGRRFGRVSLGAAAVFVHQSVDNEKASAFAGNAGGQAAGPVDGMMLGASITSLGPAIGYHEKFPLPTVIRAGFAQRLSEGLLVSLEGDLPRDSRLEGHFGTQWSRRFGAMGLALRGGFETSRMQDLGVLAGFSAGLGLGFGNLRVDMLFAMFGDLGGAYSVGLTWKFKTQDNHPPASRKLPQRSSSEIFFR